MLKEVFQRHRRSIFAHFARSLVTEHWVRCPRLSIHGEALGEKRGSLTPAPVEQRVRVFVYDKSEIWLP